MLKFLPSEPDLRLVVDYGRQKNSESSVVGGNAVTRPRPVSSTHAQYYTQQPRLALSSYKSASVPIGQPRSGVD
jgi:hypothetical protein